MSVLQRLNTSQENVCRKVVTDDFSGLFLHRPVFRIKELRSAFQIVKIIIIFYDIPLKYVDDIFTFKSLKD